LYATLGNNQKAIERYEESLRTLGCKPGTEVRRANILADLGLAYVAMGQLRKAWRPLQEARDLCQSAGYPRGLCRIDINSALLLLRQGDFKTILERADVLEADLRDLKDFYGLSKHLFNVAEAYLCQGNLAEALRCGEKSARSAAKPAGTPLSASDLRDVISIGALWRRKLSNGLLGDIHTRMGNLEAARKCYDDSDFILMPVIRSVRIWPMPYSSDRKGIFIYLENKRRGIGFEQTEEWFKRRRDTLQQRGLLWQSANLANDFADIRLEEEQPEFAIELYVEARERAEQGEFRFEEARALVGLALCHQHLGHIPSAKHFRERAMLLCGKYAYAALQKRLPQ
jgi:tetratricopeptide (TPR) repeat protein